MEKVTMQIRKRVALCEYVVVLAATALVLATTVYADSVTGWDSRAIGTVGQAGRASFANGQWTVSGSGADIWGSTDYFHFVSQPIGFQNSATIVARVLAEQNTHQFAKAGVMI